ncbi:MAG: zinc metallopeptidase [Gammaproteobacteria bacterium]
MLILIVIAVLLLLVFGPSLWVRRVIQRYRTPADRYPGTGGELAQHLIERFDLSDVTVEQTETGDHYDPLTKTIRLTPDNFDGKSLTAVTIAAHEFGHAIQDATRYGPLRWRTRLILLTNPAQKLGAGLLLLSPFIGMMSRAPSATALLFIGGLLSLGTATVVHMMTLPMELDASYGRALPILSEGDYLLDGDLPHARRLLKAAALTYVSASLLSLLNVGRWWAILRR